MTGLDHDNPIITYIIGTLKTLKGFATFEELPAVQTVEPRKYRNSGRIKWWRRPDSTTKWSWSGRSQYIGYNINLNLPATSDVAVFDAIFKSLKEHLLKE